MTGAEVLPDVSPPGPACQSLQLRDCWQERGSSLFLELFTLDSTTSVWKPIRSLPLCLPLRTFCSFRMVAPRSTSPRSEPFHREIFVECQSGVRGRNERASSCRSHGPAGRDTSVPRPASTEVFSSPAPCCAEPPTQELWSPRRGEPLCLGVVIE